MKQKPTFQQDFVTIFFRDCIFDNKHSSLILFNCFFKSFTCCKFRNCHSWNLNFFLSLRINPYSSRSLRNSKGTKTS